MLSTVTTMPYRVNCQKVMRCPVRAAMPMATTLALAATAVPLPPKSAPSANAHHSACPVAGSGACGDDALDDRGHRGDVRDVVEERAEHAEPNSSAVAATK